MIPRHRQCFLPSRLWDPCSVFSQTKLRVGDTTKSQKTMLCKGEERRFRAEIRLGDSGACVRVCPAFFVVCCLLSSPKRNFVWETPLRVKRICLAKVRNDDFGPKSASEILVRVRVCARLFHGMLSALNSQTKPRVGDTARNHMTTLGESEERSCRAEIRVGDFGVWGPGFFSWYSVCSHSPSETSCGRHH